MSLYSRLRGISGSLFQLGLTGPQLKANSTAIEARDSSDAAYAILRGADPAIANDLTNLGYTNLLVFVCKACTTVALPAYTYNNGTAGVAATITLNAHAALPTIDGVTLSVTDPFLLNNGASFIDNGPYVVTSLGNGTSTDTVLTRSIAGDTMTKILSTTIKISSGVTRRGALYEFCNNPSGVIGTDALAWLRADSNYGPNERVIISTDFNQQTAALATNGVMAGQFPGFVTLVGTASIAPAQGTATEDGIFTFSATSSTGSAAISFSAGAKPIVVSTEQFFKMAVRIAGPSAFSDGTDTFRIIAGLASGISVAATDGIWVEYTQVTSTAWLGVTRASGTSATPSVGPTVVSGGYVQAYIVKYAGETTFRLIWDGALSGTLLTTNQPIGTALTPLIIITKSLGANARSFPIDSYSVEQGFPNGRAA
jgi:hypothetical protein